MLGKSKKMAEPVYPPEVLSDIERKYSSSIESLKENHLWLVSVFAEKLLEQEARTYLLQGVCRRAGIIIKCCKNIFETFPPNRTELLSSDELDNININLHAYMINLYGLLDNLAWVYVIEHKITDLIKNKRSIGLFTKNTQKQLPKRLNDYLKLEPTKVWFKDYVQDYRDALAHRIPLYIPPSTILESDSNKYSQLDKLGLDELLQGNFDRMNELNSERDSLTSICAVFSHSTYNNQSRPLILHVQIVSDLMTVLEFIKIYTDSFHEK